MKKIHILTALALSLFMFTTGCGISSQGNTLHGFTQRMNEYPENYNLSESGYIYDANNNTLTRFFKFNKNEIMLQFECAENNEFTCLHIVFDNNCKNNSQEINFIKNCIEAFTESSEATDELLEKIDFNNAIKTTSYETKTAKSGDTELLLDTTTMGTVISINRNMQ